MNTRYFRAVWIAALAVVATVTIGPAALADGAEGPNFATDVWPILEAKCVTCHGPEDAFNRLRLDSAAAILKGGKNGKVLVPGDLEGSPMYVRTTLPADDLDIMPAEGDPLTPDEVEALGAWISAGADFGGWEAP